MSVSFQRAAYVALVMVQAALIAAMQQNSLDPKWAAWAGLASTVVAGLLQVLKPGDVAAAAKHVSMAWVRVASIAMLCLCVVGCKDPKTQNDVNDFIGSLEQAACVLVADEMGITEPTELVAVCSIAPRITPDILRWIEQLLAAKHKAAARLARDGGAK